MKRLATKSAGYKIKIKTDKTDSKLRWIICQHCKKPVYGTLISDSFLPTELMNTWKWEVKSNEPK